MKRKTLFLAVFTILFFLGCATGNKITYNIPRDYPKDKRAELLAAIKKGKELYRINCAECHGIFTKGKDNIPDFTTTQIDNYSARFMRHDPKNHSVARKMSPEQLNDILMFLRYKKIKDQDNVVSKRPRGRR